ncbi:hypothetical protein M0R45_002287 [Rubus argutus]|uniref:Uncharacterized protein n=1 Tax=Rubus argutus TaxID=59490 RepID=A0AAW1VJI2_RUBAR
MTAPHLTLPPSQITIFNPTRATATSFSRRQSGNNEEQIEDQRRDERTRQRKKKKPDHSACFPARASLRARAPTPNLINLSVQKRKREKEEMKEEIEA